VSSLRKGARRLELVRPSLTQSDLACYWLQYGYLAFLALSARLPDIGATSIPCWFLAKSREESGALQQAACPLSWV
jgi:hypothetical protein